MTTTTVLIVTIASIRSEYRHVIVSSIKRGAHIRSISVLGGNVDVTVVTFQRNKIHSVSVI